MAMKLYVGNLSFQTTSEDLQQLFSQVGTVESAAVVEDRDTGRSRGFGFVEMASKEEGDKTIEQFNGTDFAGRNLTVNEAKPREDRGGRGGGYGGNRGGGGRGGYGGGGGRGNSSRWQNWEAVKGKTWRGKTLFIQHSQTPIRSEQQIHHSRPFTIHYSRFTREVLWKSRQLKRHRNRWLRNKLTRSGIVSKSCARCARKSVATS